MQPGSHRTSERGAVHDRALIDPPEAARVCTRVHELRPHWESRHPSQPFYTLGTPSYLDARNGSFTSYQSKACQLNALIQRNFGPLLERVRQALCDHVGGEVVYADDRLALPGFHIFLFDPAFRRPSTAGSHFDLQYELIDWHSFGPLDVRAQLSVTLALALPASGGGLMVWNLDKRELDAMPVAERVAFARANRRATCQPYTVGHLVVHSGYQLHQIAPAPDMQPGDQRVTLQGHMIRVGSRWVLYW